MRYYKEIALVYNHLMRSIDYKGWAKYIKYLYDEAEVEGENVLEIAAGTCLLADHLKKTFPGIIASDLSREMLSIKEHNGFPKVCCNMTALPFKNKFDFIFSTFDSVNYLIEEYQIKGLLEGIGSILNDSGCFAFDVSLERNSLKYVKALNRKGKCDGIKYVQYSDYNKETKIHTNRFKIQLQDGKLIEEVHKQKIYDFYDYFRIIEESDFYVESCYDAFSFDEVTEKTERAQFIIKKKCEHAEIS